MSELKRFGVPMEMGTYGTRLRARTDPKHPCNRSFGQPAFRPPDEDAVEEKFQEQLQAGFKLYKGKGKDRRKNVCGTCFQVLTATGTCNCE